MTRKNFGLIAVLASIGVATIGFMLMDYNPRWSTFDNVMRSRVYFYSAPASTRYPGQDLAFDPAAAPKNRWSNSIPYRYLFSICLAGVLAGAFLMLSQANGVASVMKNRE